ncbi:MAG: hypothetical protein IJF65_02615 [Clostridia bacterium]|nr:hypothetical protein [Clostridia bacterium]
MSRGIGGKACLVLQDDSAVLYQYYCYDLNHADFRNPDRIMDGHICIKREAFAEPEIHERIRRLPSGRRRSVTKRVPVPIDWSRILDEKWVTVENSRYCRHRYSWGADRVAWHLMDSILMEYQKTGTIPDKVWWDI